MSEREFVDGAFYWVRFVQDDGPSEWVPARYLHDEARLRPDECWQPWGTIWSYRPDRMEEIGPMIGKEPPDPNWKPRFTIYSTIPYTVEETDGVICISVCEKPLTPRDNPPKLAP